MFELKEILELVEINPQVLFVKNESEAFAYCKKIALGHYENFPVGSIILPKKIRKHVFSIYAFSRIADDIADEVYAISKEDRLSLLNKFIANLEKVIKEKVPTLNPIYLSLSITIQERQLPLEPFEKLITAFKMDVDFRQPNDYDDLLDYCQYSACPIGELILRLFDEYNEENAKKSDAITSALQLINFWQDLSVDRENGRNYIPENKNLSELFDFTENLLNFGTDLPNFIKNIRLKIELRLIINAGLKMIAVLRQMNEKLFIQRPVLKKSDYLGILFKSILWKY
jgi:phytoene/squalene synthetase